MFTESSAVKIHNDTDPVSRWEADVIIAYLQKTWNFFRVRLIIFVYVDLSAKDDFLAWKLSVF